MNKVMSDPPTTAEDVSQWFHGSPIQMAALRCGSTITPDRVLAEVFGQKPTSVSLEDNGVIRHNGTATGYLYTIDEEVSSSDVKLHPNSSMKKGLEWITTRPLKVRYLAQP